MDLNKLKKVMTLCRKAGVNSIEVTENGVTTKIEFGQTSPKRTYTKTKDAIMEQTLKAPSPEEMLMWSSL